MHRGLAYFDADGRLQMWNERYAELVAGDRRILTLD